MRHGQGARDCSAGPEAWVVLDRECNYSTFSGRHWTPSSYSAVMCLGCGWHWRTNAKYVRGLRDATEKERLS